MFYDVLFCILSMGINEKIFTKDDIVNLRRTCRLFRNILMNNKRLKAYNVMDKYLKNIRHKLLYTYYSSALGVHRATREIDKKGLSMLDKNICKYYAYQNLNEIILPSIISKLEEARYDSRIYNITHQGDLLSSIMIHGKDITRIELWFAGRMIYKKYMLKGNVYTTIKPFESGMNLVGLNRNYWPYIKICDGTVKSIHVRYHYVEYDERKSLIFDPKRLQYNFVNDCKMYNFISYSNGDCNVHS